MGWERSHLGSQWNHREGCQGLEAVGEGFGECSGSATVPGDKPTPVSPSLGQVFWAAMAPWPFPCKPKPNPKSFCFATTWPRTPNSPGEKGRIWPPFLRKLRKVVSGLWALEMGCKGGVPGASPARE